MRAIKIMPMAQGKWRRGWDSNPRYGLSPYNGLANPPKTADLLAEIATKHGISELSVKRSRRFMREVRSLAMARDPAQYDPRSGRPRLTLGQVLDRYTVAPSGCWEWTGTKNEKGYGIVCLMIDGKPNTMPAPRLQWMRLKGKPKDGHDICHTCDNPACINPDHLWEGTPKDNIHDMIAKGRARFQGLRKWS